MKPTWQTADTPKAPFPWFGGKRRVADKVWAALGDVDQYVEPFAGSLASAIFAFGLFVAFCVAQVGSLFSSVAWENVTFIAGEVKEPRRNIPRSLAAGTGLVITLYLLANVAYLCLLPLDKIQNAPDR